MVMRRLAGAVAALLFGFSVISSSALAQSDWRPRFDHGAVAEGDATYKELLGVIIALRSGESTSSEDDQALGDAWMALLAHVEENYPIGGDFHLEVQDVAIDPSGLSDPYQKHEVATMRSE